MKLIGILAVFSAVVIGAHSKVLTEEDVDRIYAAELQREADSEGGDAVFAIEDVLDVEDGQNVHTVDNAPEQFSVGEEQRFPQGLQRSYEVNESPDDGTEQPAPAIDRNDVGIVPLSWDRPDNFYIPIVFRTCVNSTCVYICSLLGYPHGNCVSSNTCQCYN